jgi:hypothetical protein
MVIGGPKIWHLHPTRSLQLPPIQNEVRHCRSACMCLRVRGLLLLDELHEPTEILLPTTEYLQLTNPCGSM